MNHLKEFSQLPFAHHAYGIESTNSIYGEIEKNITKDNFSYVVHKSYDTLKIDDARMIKSLQSEKTEKPSLFILEFSFINKEAQNALLKVLEEPSKNTYFILVFPEQNKLLPTLRSRLEIISISDNQSTEEVNFCTIEDFKSKTMAERFELIKSKTDKKKENVVSKKDILIFLDNFEIFETKLEKPNAQLLEAIIAARESLHANGASMKMILDMLAIHVHEK